MEAVVVLLSEVAGNLPEDGPLGFMVGETLLGLPTGTLSLDEDTQGNSLACVVFGQISDDMV